MYVNLLVFEDQGGKVWGDGCMMMSDDGPYH